jgi:hypothetical protein
MRKNSVIMGLALALTLGATAAATAQGTTRPERPYGAQQDSGSRRGPGGRGGPEGMLLRGITLSADQQTRMQQLAESRRKQSGGERPSGDDAQREQRRNERIASIRAILTDDQRVQFDKNVAEMKARGAERGRGGQDQSNHDQ